MDSKELEKKAARHRQDAVQTGHEINNDLSPGALLDKYYFRGGDATLSGYLKRVQQDPIPGALIGAAVAWTIGHEERQDHPKLNVEVSAQDRLERDGSQIEVSDPSRNAPSRNDKGTMAKGQEKLNETMESAKHGLSNAKHRASDATHKVTDRMSSATQELRSEGERVFNSEPLVNVALGFSLGAALGAMTPMSQPEHEYLSSGAEKLKDEAYRMKDKAQQISGDLSDDIVRH